MPPRSLKWVAVPAPWPCGCFVNYPPANAHYLGVDLSDTMVSLARHRLDPFAPRARVERTDGAMRFPADDGTFDRFLSAYVFDLSPPELIAAALTEAGQIFVPAACSV